MKTISLGLLTLLAVLLSPIASGQVYKCEGRDGKITLQQAPCSAGTKEKLMATEDARTRLDTMVGRGGYSDAPIESPRPEMPFGERVTGFGADMGRINERIRNITGNPRALNLLNQAQELNQTGRDLLPPPPPVSPAVTPVASTPRGGVEIVPGSERELLLDPQASAANTVQQQTTSHRRSYLDRFAGGAVIGAVIGAILGLFILVRAYIRKVQEPANEDHQMNDNRKLLCIGIIAIIVAMAVYPPFQVHWQGGVRSLGYGWIFSPPLDGAATIDVAMLIVQWVIVLGIGAIAFVLLRNRS